MKGSFACTCTADFAGDSCDLELNACFTREEPCNETGTAMCENLDPFTSNSPFECVCKPGLGININSNIIINNITLFISISNPNNALL